MQDIQTTVPPLAKALAKRGYENLTPVQLEVTKPELEDQDLLVSAQTGSGKTVGFGIAIAPTLLEGADKLPAAGAPLSLVIAPTRELALQVMRELQWLYEFTGARVVSCVGGMDYRTEKRALERGAHIVVGTPGRLRDHIQRNSLDLSNIRAAVLDEADEMLDLGFREDLEFILGESPDERRTLLFSATVPRGIANLARNFQKDAKRIETKSEAKQHSDISYRALPVNPADLENGIINMLRFHEAQNALVFCNTRATVNRMLARFSNRGFSVVALSGELSQAERTHALQAMRDGRARVCIATDVAARGIDLPGLELVIHADLPSNAETLLHRSGRTGRAGRKGISALMVPVRMRKKAERLLQFAKVTAEWESPPTADDVRKKDVERLMTHEALTAEIKDEEREMVEMLTGGHNADALAAALVRFYSEKHSAPEEIATVNTDAPPKREAFGPSTWISLAIGYDQNADPRWLLPMVCRGGDINRDAIGAIRIQDKESFVEIAQGSFDAFKSAIGAAQELEDGVKVQILDKPPVLAQRKGRPGGKPGGRPGGKFGDKPRGGDRDRGGFGDKPRGNRDDKPRGSYGDKPSGGYDREEGRPARNDRGPKSSPHERKPKGDGFSDSVRPYKERSKSSEGGKPAGKYGDKPAGKYGDKPAGKFGDKPRGKPSDKPRGKYGDAPAGKPAGKPAAKPAKPNFSADPSKSLRKPRVARGANAMPTRKKT